MLHPKALASSSQLSSLARGPPQPDSATSGGGVGVDPGAPLRHISSKGKSPQQVNDYGEGDDEEFLDNAAQVQRALLEKN